MELSLTFMGFETTKACLPDDLIPVDRDIDTN